MNVFQGKSFILFSWHATIEHRDKREVKPVCDGIPLNVGHSSGKVSWYIPKEYRKMTKPTKTDPDKQWETLQRALPEAETAWRALSETLFEDDSSLSNEILEAQIAMAKDVDVLKQAKHAIYHDNKSADLAYQEAMGAYISHFEKLEDNLFKQRAQDIKDVLARVLSHYYGVHHETPVFHEDTVLMAKDLHPGVLLELIQPRCVAIVLEQGSLNSHMAIIAKQLTIPVIIQVAQLQTTFSDGDYVMVDGKRGCVCHADKPSKETLSSTLETNSVSPSQDALTPPCELAVNVMGLKDYHAFKASGAKAIGLYRTEFLHDVTRGGQAASYQPYFALDVPMIVRLFDYGADKVAPNMDDLTAHSQLGLRGIRWLKKNPQILQTQLHALFDAAANKTLQIELPMVTTSEEYYWGIETAKALLTSRKDAHLPIPKKIRFGPLIEVPSAALSLESYIDACDFIAIGTNDLHQYFFAADRQDPTVSTLYDVHEPAFLQLIAQVISMANKHALEVTICGQMAAEPLSAWLLSGLGTVTLSVPIPTYRSLARHLSRLNQVSLAKQLRDQVLASSACDERVALLEQLKQVVNNYA